MPIALQLVLLGLAFIGLLHLTRGTAVRRVRGVGADGATVGVNEPHIPLSVTMVTGAWVLPGTHVEVALNADGTYPRLWQDLRSARRSITLQLYYGNRGCMADTLREILIERATAGVRCSCCTTPSALSTFLRTTWQSCRQARSRSSRSGRSGSFPASYSASSSGSR